MQSYFMSFCVVIDVTKWFRAKTIGGISYNLASEILYIYVYTHAEIVIFL